jgi:hypothetical protein
MVFFLSSAIITLKGWSANLSVHFPTKATATHHTTTPASALFKTSNMLSNHQNRAQPGEADSAGTTTKGQTTLSSTDTGYTLDHRESNKRDNVLKNEILPRRRTYAYSSVNEVARAFEISVAHVELTEKAPLRCRGYVICSAKEFREAFELGPNQHVSDVSHVIMTLYRNKT